MSNSYNPPQGGSSYSSSAPYSSNGDSYSGGGSSHSSYSQSNYPSNNYSSGGHSSGGHSGHSSGGHSSGGHSSGGHSGGQSNSGYSSNYPSSSSSYQSSNYSNNYDRGQDRGYDRDRNNSRSDNRYDNRDRNRDRDRDYRSGGSSYGGGNRFDNRGGYPSSSGGYGGNKFGGQGNFGGDKMGSLGANLRNLDWNTMELVPFVKDFYTEHESIRDLSDYDVENFRRSNDMTVYGSNIPKPIRTFEEACFPEYILNMIKECGYSAPTPIQCQGWPMAMSGRDVIGISATGSGKTLAFILPSIVHINAQDILKPGDGPIVLVLAPTRELAMQTMKECGKFAAISKIKYSCCYGGTPKGAQARELRSGIEVLIATPGRLIDFLETNTTNLRRVTYLVLDEADRMLDMGFEKQIRQIVSQIRPDRQTLLWSATWPKEIEQLANEFTKNPIQVTIGSSDLTANINITQKIKVIRPEDKIRELLRQLETADLAGKTIIFTGTKRAADDLVYNLKNNDFPARSLHGDKTQDERDYVLKQFKEGSMKIMIATDVAARGIDVKDVNTVINYDFPSNLEDYVHRIGRTGRAGNKGNAISFFNAAEDSKKARGLIDILNQTNQDIPQELRDCMSYGGSGSGKGGNNNYRGRR